MVEVSSMEGNKLHKSCEGAGPFLVKQPVILPLYERSCTLGHCQRPVGNRRISITKHSSEKRNQLTRGI